MAELLHSWRETVQTQEVPAGTVHSIPQRELALIALPDPLALRHTQMHFPSFQQRPWGREEVLHLASCSHMTVLLSAKVGGFLRCAIQGCSITGACCTHPPRWSSALQQVT